LRSSLIAVGVGVVFMVALELIPYLSLVNLFFGFWFFLGGCLVAAVRCIRDERRRDLGADFLGALIAGLLASILSAAPTFLKIQENVQFFGGELKKLALYPDQDLTSPEVYDAWVMVVVSVHEMAIAELEEELRDGNVTQEDVDQKLAEMKPQLEQNLRQLQSFKKISEGTEAGALRTYMNFVAQSGHGILRGLLKGSLAPLLPFLLIPYALRSAFLVFVTILGGLLVGWLLADSPDSTDLHGQSPSGSEILSQESTESLPTPVPQG
jgi:hypothetical protein